MNHTGPGAVVRDLILSRAMMACERCGTAVLPGASQIHHRQPRGMGGSSNNLDINSPANLILLCSTCHTWVESNRTVSYKQGWLVRREHNPGKTPVWLAGRGFCFLTEHGDIEETDE